MYELLAVLCRLPGSQSPKVQEALSLVEALGIVRVGNGHELLALAAYFAGQWNLSGYDAVYVALAGTPYGAGSRPISSSTCAASSTSGSSVTNHLIATDASTTITTVGLSARPAPFRRPATRT